MHMQPRLTTQTIIHMAFKKMDYAHKLAALERVVNTQQGQKIPGIGNQKITTTKGVAAVFRLFCARCSLMGQLDKEAKKVTKDKQELFSALSEEIARGTTKHTDPHTNHTNQ